MKLSGQARKDEAFRLAKSLQQQSSFFTKKREERNTHASYAVSKLIAEKMVPFAEGEFVKECLMVVVDIVCPEKKCYSPTSVFLDEESRDELKT